MDGVRFPEPGAEADTGVLLARYLDFCRESVVARLRSRPEAELRRSRLPSGWTPLELAVHLAAVEHRWLVWGFLGEPVTDPWADEVAGRWHAPEALDLDTVVSRLRAGGRRTTEVLSEHALDELAPPGPRFEDGPASLAGICFHLLQEHARHLGQLDVAVELSGGPTGE